jgi:hypothetical protein
MQERRNAFLRATQRAIFWALVVGSGLAAGLLGTSAIAQHAQSDSADGWVVETAEASAEWIPHPISSSSCDLVTISTRTPLSRSTQPPAACWRTISW